MNWNRCSLNLLLRHHHVLDSELTQALRNARLKASASHGLHNITTPLSFCRPSSLLMTLSFPNTRAHRPSH